MHDRELTFFETFRGMIATIATFRDFSRLSKLKNFINSIKHYGQDNVFMEKMKYVLWKRQTFHEQDEV